MQLIVSASGIRGTFEPSKDSSFFVNLGYVLGRYLRGRISLARDTRPSSPALCSALMRGLVASEVSPIYCGLCTVPVVAHAVRKGYVSASIIVTASHNPPQWNEIKVFAGEGLILGEDESRNLVEEARSLVWEEAKPLGSGTSTPEMEDTGLLDAYVDDLLRLASVLGAEECSSSVVVDACNSPSALTIPRILRGMGCEVEVLNSKLNGTFGRTIEPLPENLVELCNKVSGRGADLGAAFDCDGDRVVLVTGDGEALREDFTLALAVDYYLSLRKGPVVVNRGTSLLLDHICRNHGVMLARTGVGERVVAAKMLEAGSSIGGEGSSAGVIMPEFALARDGGLALILVLALLKRERKSLSSLVRRYPRFYLSRCKLECGPEKARTILSKVKAEAESMGAVDVSDDLRVSGSEWWVLVRPSSTEPAIRLLSEARSMEEADSRLKDFVEMIKRDL